MDRKAMIYDTLKICDTAKECAECPIRPICNIRCLYSRTNILDEINKANKIILDWIDKHQPKTRQSEFLKMFPNTKIAEDGFSQISPCALDANLSNKSQCSIYYCEDCRKKYWLEEIE